MFQWGKFTKGKAKWPLLVKRENFTLVLMKVATSDFECSVDFECDLFCNYAKY